MLSDKHKHSAPRAGKELGRRQPPASLSLTSDPRTKDRKIVKQRDSNITTKKPTQKQFTPASSSNSSSTTKSSTAGTRKTPPPRSTKSPAGKKDFGKPEGSQGQKAAGSSRKSPSKSVSSVLPTSKQLGVSSTKDSVNSSFLKRASAANPTGVTKPFSQTKAKQPTASNNQSSSSENPLKASSSSKFNAKAVSPCESQSRALEGLLHIEEDHLSRPSLALDHLTSSPPIKPTANEEHDAPEFESCLSSDSSFDR